MSDIFQKLMNIGLKIGEVTTAHLYDNDFITIEGVTPEGKKFSIALHVKEEEPENESVL